MKMLSKSLCLTATVGVGLFAFVSTSRPAIVGPYGVDANTLHLWHIEETSLNVADGAVSTPIPLTSLGAGGGNALGTASYPGFGNAYSGVAVANTGLFALTPTNSTADNTSTTSIWNQTTGAFTFECIVRIDFDPTTITTASDFAMLISMDQDTGTRPFYWTLNPVNGGYTMLLQGISSGGLVESAQLPMTQGHWYHAAATYDGNANTAGNTQMYWTDMGTQALPDGSATVASLIHSGNLLSDFTGATGDLAIGAEARSTQSGEWLGLIDEVRISDVVRGADQFIFVPEPSTMMLAICCLAAIGLKKMRYCKEGL